MAATPSPTGVLGTVALACLLAAPGPAGAEGAVEDPPSFADEVRPILEARCLECHGSHMRRPKGRLWLDSRAKALKGGVGGPALVPGDPDASLLIQAVRYADEWLEMPPEEKLSDGEIDVLERWVRAGAPWPEDVEVRYRPPEEEPTAELAEGAAEPEFPPEALQFFEREVRPLLARNCFECHGPEVSRPKSGLAMTGRAALLAGGESGPALVPGDPDGSLLVRAVRYADAERRMPPSGKLPDAEVRVLEEWVQLGAPWPGGAVHPTVAASEGYDFEAARRRWAFRPVERPAAPDVPAGEHVAGPIDAFVVHRLAEAGLAPVGRATDRELVRRVFADLVGLPATLADVEAFEARAASDWDAAWRALVDDLLARPQYGERWARHWLDVVRFAQTNGYERDTEKPFAWRYRDWVIDALNRDLPYDEFLLQQLAGDELDEVTDASRIATGFYRLGAWDDEPNDPVQADYDELDDVVRAISEGLLGVTMGCARCHDHKFDPFPQEDYYSLLAFVRSVDPYEDPRFALDSPTHRLLDRSDESLTRWEAERREAIAAAEGEIDAVLARGRQRAVRDRISSLPEPVQQAYRTDAVDRDDAQRKLLRTTPALRPTRQEAVAYLEEDESLELRERTAAAAGLRDSFAGSLPWALTVRDAAAEPVPTHLLLRGRASTPGPEVPPRFPRVLAPDDAAAAPPPPAAPARPYSTGRRRSLAEWIARPENPLTARVIVNRVWHHHFGRGLVPTPNDFGSTGVPATHPELLDWLAAEFVAQEWSLKWLHREILTSRTWQRSSRAANAAAEAADPGNDLLWRQRLRRLEAEALRDAVLAVCGSLVDEAGGRGFFPALSREALAGMSRPGRGWEADPEEHRSRRGVYAFVKRGTPVPFLTTFDAPTASLPVGARATTSSATQALTLLNSDFVNRQADLLAERVRAEAGAEPAAQAVRAFERVLARRPAEEEQRLVTTYLAEQTRAFEDVPQPIVFRPRVPERLDMGYLDRLPPDALYYGPSTGWRYGAGRWSGSYNGTMEWSATHGPAALWEEAPFLDGALEARLRVEPGSTLAALLVRARLEDGLAHGLELAILPAAGRVELRRTGDDDESTVLAGADLELGEREVEVRIELRGPDVRVLLDGAPLLRARDAATAVRGLAGVRTRTEGLVLERFAVERGGVRRDARPDDPGSPDQRALQSLCLLLLNLDEFAHVD